MSNAETQTEPPRIFISYRIADTLPVADRLAAELRRGFGADQVFFDRRIIEPGDNWPSRIEIALMGATVVLVLIGKQWLMAKDKYGERRLSLPNDWVRREVEAALASPALVIPVLVDGAEPPPTEAFSRVPSIAALASCQATTLRSAEWDRDFLALMERLATLVQLPEAPREVPRVPMMTEAPPPDFVQRPHEFDALRRLLLDRQRGEPVSITAALKGAGGYGKTTLAQALCHDEDVKEVFHDGILRVTLGERPDDLTAKVANLIEMLENERRGYPDAQSASAYLDQLLTDRSMLIVIDDVWNAAHARPFLRGGERCAHLITTRDAATLPSNVRRVAVDQMCSSEAVNLLGAGIQGADGQALSTLAGRLGEWPLLVKLVNAQLRERVHEEGQSVVTAIDDVNRELDKYGLVAFDARNPEARDQAVTSTLGVSLNVLKEDERARLTELAVFPEDIEVPLQVVARPWHTTASLDDLDTNRLARRLFRISLLQSLDLNANRLRIHDVVRSFLGQQLGEGALRTLHGRFLDAWGLDDWSALSSGEPYLWHHLIWHLREAGRLVEQRALLLGYRWLRAKLNATDITTLLADYSCAPDEPGIQAVEGALRLSAHVLGPRKAELPSQLTGRLLRNAESSVRLLCEEIRKTADEPWLRPLQVALTPPGGPLLQTL